jgi:probable rRNA maturation factor
VKRPAPARPPAPAGELLIRNRQRVRAVNTTFLRQFTRAVLAEQTGLTAFTLGIHLVSAAEMASVNETYLNHQGSTDVITFDHTGEPTSGMVFGELFICLDDAVKQAREFGTSWQAELARYVIHGILHLRGHDDLAPAARRRMKREEDRLLRELARRHPLGRLERRGRTKRA